MRRPYQTGIRRRPCELDRVPRTVVFPPRGGPPGAHLNPGPPSDFRVVRLGGVGRTGAIWARSVGSATPANAETAARSRRDSEVLFRTRCPGEASPWQKVYGRRLDTPTGVARREAPGSEAIDGEAARRLAAAPVALPVQLSVPVLEWMSWPEVPFTLALKK